MPVQLDQKETTSTTSLRVSLRVRILPQRLPPYQSADLEPVKLASLHIASCTLCSAAHIMQLHSGFDEQTMGRYAWPVPNNTCAWQPLCKLPICRGKEMHILIVKHVIRLNSTLMPLHCMHQLVWHHLPSMTLHYVLLHHYSALYHSFNPEIQGLFIVCSQRGSQ